MLLFFYLKKPLDGWYQCSNKLTRPRSNILSTSVSKMTIQSKLSGYNESGSEDKDDCDVGRCYAGLCSSCMVMYEKYCCLYDSLTYVYFVFLIRCVMVWCSVIMLGNMVGGFFRAVLGGDSPNYRQVFLNSLLPITVAAGLLVGAYWRKEGEKKATGTMVGGLTGLMWRWKCGNLQ